MHRLVYAARWRTVLCAVLVLVLSPTIGGPGARADGCGVAIPTTGAAAPSATVETLSIAGLRVPRDRPLRTTSRLTLPPGAVWDAAPGAGSLLLILDRGTVCASPSDGVARIARPARPLLDIGTLAAIGPGEGATLRADDRLVLHGAWSLSVRNVGNGPATATIIQVTPALPRGATLRATSPTRDEAAPARQDETSSGPSGRLPAYLGHGIASGPWRLPG